MTDVKFHLLDTIYILKSRYLDSDTSITSAIFEKISKKNKSVVEIEKKMMIILHSFTVCKRKTLTKLTDSGTKISTIYFPEYFYISMILNFGGRKIQKKIKIASK